MDDPMVLVMILYVSFSVLSIFDSSWFHLWRQKLYARSASVKEHRWHMAEIGAFGISTFFLFGLPAVGLPLWLGTGFALLLAIAEGFDMLEERRSRASLGGLPHGEYMLHVLMVGLRLSATVLFLATLPPAAWRLDASARDVPLQPEWVGFLAWLLVMGSALMVVIHVLLDLAARPRRAGRTSRPV